MNNHQRYLDEPVHLSFPREIQTPEQKTLYALWREDSQCVAGLAALTRFSTDDMRDIVRQLSKAGKIDIEGDLEGPAYPLGAMCHLNKQFVASLRR